MRVTWLTDLHLNFLKKEPLNRFLGSVKRETPDAIFVTGDTGESHNVCHFIEELRRIAPVYFVLGNHDFYGSSIAEVRRHARDTGCWLPALAPIRLTDRTMLVGVDGWGDARCGNLESRVRLADWQWIRDLDTLMLCPPEQRARALQVLGTEEAAALRDQLERLEPALKPSGEPAGELIVLTHVPPFAEACWHDGKQSEPDWLPWFTCIAVGEVLRAYARRVPATKITVLCGHTHGRGEYRPRDNLLVRTGGWAPGERDYGNPIVQASWSLS